MARRGIELFDEYIKTGIINPCKCRIEAHQRLTCFRSGVVQRLFFLEQKAKKGKRPKTISDHSHASAKLCRFLIDRGVMEFNAITPEIIKEFNLQDYHKTAKGKGTFNGMIRKFLIFLYREGFHNQPNLHLALPRGAAPVERIIDVLTENEKKTNPTL